MSFCSRKRICSYKISIIHSSLHKQSFFSSPMSCVEGHRRLSFIVRTVALAHRILQYRHSDYLVPGQIGDIFFVMDNKESYQANLLGNLM